MWDDAAACAKALSARALKLMAAMEFQDLATQHIDRTVLSIKEGQARLQQILLLFDIPPQGDALEPTAPASTDIGDPAQSHGSRQALADQHLAELK